ncbi:hypothetical protein PanWU01x14_219160 [Parasponia andersonii]|uniref:Uncharacterized protein n=1 Tax=Parasponia andersonii TaxID=3476 RepID=A0A2P5BQJ4_PARAD|nr:hypothetical protein PanWU01x14_219160 [Parasponia andersonii]
MVYVIDGVGFPLEGPEGWSSEVSQFGLHLDPIREGHPADPSHSLLSQIIGGLAVMGPKPLTQLCHHFLLLVGKHTFKAFLVSFVHCHFSSERPRLALFFSLHP